MPRLKDFKKLSESRVPVGGACALSPAPGPFSAEAARKQSQQQQREETDSILAELSSPGHTVASHEG